MKFLGLALATLSLVPSVLGAPVIEQRDVTPVEAISNSIAILQDGASKNEASMKAAIQNAGDNVEYAVSIAASVRANLDAIADGFKKAAEEIVAAIEASAGGVGGQGKALVQAEIDGLQKDLETLKAIIAGISAMITFEVTNLVPQAQVMIQAEMDFVKAAIAPVVNPIMVFADAASKASAKATVIVSGLQGAYDGVVVMAQRFAYTNGLPGADFPKFKDAPPVSVGN